MKRNRNAVFKAFNDTIVSELAALDIHPIGNLSWHDKTPEFEIDTTVGKYRFHHGLNCNSEDKKPLNFLEVMGKFEDVQRAKVRVNCNPYNGKWNHHTLIYIDDIEEAKACATNIITHILSI